MERLKLRVGVIVMHSWDTVGFYAEASTPHWLMAEYLVMTHIIGATACTIGLW